MLPFRMHMDLLLKDTETKYILGNPLKLMYAQDWAVDASSSIATPCPALFSCCDWLHCRVEFLIVFIMNLPKHWIWNVFVLNLFWLYYNIEYCVYLFWYLMCWLVCGQGHPHLGEVGVVWGHASPSTFGWTFRGLAHPYRQSSLLVKTGAAHPRVSIEESTGISQLALSHTVYT